MDSVQNNPINIDELIKTSAVATAAPEKPSGLIISDEVAVGVPTAVTTEAPKEYDGPGVVISRDEYEANRPVSSNGIHIGTQKK